MRCLKRCVRCGSYGDVEHIKRSTEGDICLKCDRLMKVGRPDIF
jgi:recombinational DNA repair protein (RecF pathway)